MLHLYLWLPNVAQMTGLVYWLGNRPWALVLVCVATPCLRGPPHIMQAVKVVRPGCVESEYCSSLLLARSKVNGASRAGPGRAPVHHAPPPPLRQATRALRSVAGGLPECPAVPAAWRHLDEEALHRHPQHFPLCNAASRCMPCVWMTAPTHV